MNPIEWLNSFISRALRVLRISYRPTREEFYTTLKVTGLGMIAIGVIGLIISVIFQFIEK